MSGRWRIRHGDHRAGPRPRRLRAGAGLPAALTAVLFAAAGRAQDLRDLTGSQRDQLARGAVLVTSRPVEGYPWPEVTVYRLVAAGFFGVRLGSPESTAHCLQEIAQALARHVERLRAAEAESLHGLVRGPQAMLGEP